MLGGLALGLTPVPAWAATRRLQAVPGVQPMRAVAQVVTDREARKRFEFRLDGRGSPAGRITLPTWYGAARLAGTVRVAGRDLALLVTEGNTGTGVYQELLVIAGVDNARVLRILGIETLSARDNMDCAFAQTLAGTVRAAPDGRSLTVAYRGRGVRNGECGRGAPRTRRVPWSEQWTVDAPWQGDGVLPAAKGAGRTGSVARRLDKTRARVQAWLNEAPRQTLADADMDRLALYSTFQDA